MQLRTEALQRWLALATPWADGRSPTSLSPDSSDGANSLLAVGLNYHVAIERRTDRLAVARYAWGRDYYCVVNQRLGVGRWLEKQRPIAAGVSAWMRTAPGQSLGRRSRSGMDRKAQHLSPIVAPGW